MKGGNFMKKAIIIITAAGRKKEDRFISCQNDEQEWVDGWGFLACKKYMYRLNSNSLLPSDDLCDLNLSNCSTCIIWINQYKWNSQENEENQTELCDSMINLINKLNSHRYSIQIAYHDLDGDILDKLKNSEKSLTFKSYGLTDREKFIKITKKQNDKYILDSGASFEKIEESFFQPLVYIKKKLINLWLPLAIDIQGLSEVYQKSQHAENKEAWRNKALEYWKEIKTSMENGGKKFEQLLEEHNKIIEESTLDGSADEKNEKFVNFLSNFLKNLDSTKNNELPKKYLNPEDKNSFFPNWLEDYVRQLNEKTEK